MKRRNFIKLSATASVVSLTPFQLQAAIKTFKPYFNCPDISNRKLVLINLVGANDGLNTLVPLNQYDTYANLRPTIKIPTNQYITLDSTLPSNQQVGLNPALNGIKSLYDKGWLRILQGVGYPNQNKSHFKSKDIYSTGNDGNGDLNGGESGWIGRFMEKHYENLIIENYPLAVETGSTKTSLSFHAKEAHGLSLNITEQDPDGFFSIINGLAGEKPSNIPDSDYGKQIEYLTSTDQLSNIYAESISNAFKAGQNIATYPDTDLADQLKTVARLISGELKSKVFMVSISGFDTHNLQIQGIDDMQGRHYELLDELSGAISAFTTDLDNLGIADDVVGVTFSEFGRKARENGNFGTDHGEIAPMFVFGKPVAGGMSGVNPDLSEAIEDNNYQIKTIQYDYRQTFATILQNFLGASDSIIDYAFFNHSLNESFTSSKVNNLLRDQYSLDMSCYNTLSSENSNTIKDWLLYPTAFDNEINISGIKNIGTIKYKIYNTSGLLVKNGSGEINHGALKLNVSFLSSGVYIFEISSNGKKEIHKGVKL